MNAVVGIIILSYNNIDDTLECINSINQCEQQNFEVRVYLVDNSDDDIYPTTLSNETQVFKFIRTENNGYAAGNNIGIKAAIEDGCNYIVVINNDTIVDKAFLRPLIESLSKDKVALAAPVIYRYCDGSVWSSGGRYRRLLCDFAMTQNCIPDVPDTEFINGCCFATKSELFDTLGYINETYFMYNEDSEFCLRILKNNMSNVICKDSKIYHKVSVTSGDNSPMQLYYIYRNRLKMAYDSYHGLHRGYAILINEMKIIYRMYKERKRNEVVNALKYALVDAKSVCGRATYWDNDKNTCE